MAEEKGKFEPFKPSEPAIPGVSGAAGKTESRAGKQSSPRMWMAIGIVGALVAVGVIAMFSLRSHGSGETAGGGSGATAAAEAAAKEEPSARQALPVAPGEVALVSELARPWATKEFVFRKPFTNEEVPAMIVRLPGGSAQSGVNYWAFVARTPFGTCGLEWVTDRTRLEREFRYKARHPMVVDPCEGTVYDPMRHGPVGGALVRGEVVAGSGLRPPLAIEVRVQGGKVLADRME